MNDHNHVFIEPDPHCVECGEPLSSIEWDDEEPAA